VGSRRKAYGGPLDQVTRIWDDSPVDSIGGTKTEVRYGYDARGRLKADTAYTGTVARITSHVYDRYERDSVTTDALGSWKTLYETLRGYPIAQVTPYGDSVVYSYDAQSRAMGPDIWNAGIHRVKGAQHWLPNGTIDTLATTTYASGTGFNSGSWFRPAAPVGGDAGEVALAPYWSQQPGAGTALQMLTDSLLYDAWQRLIRWKLIKDGVKLDSVEYAFDRAGNINQTAAAAYDAVTDRLLTRGSGAAADSMSYDRDGNLTRWRTSAGVVWTYGYDGLNQLVSVRRNGTLIVRYAYDVQGRRVAKRVYSTASGGTLGLTRFSYHGGEVGFETDSAGTTIGLRYTWGKGADQLLAARDAAGNHFYTTRDRLGSIRTLTTSAGAWRLSEAFTPYGTSLVRDTAVTGVGIVVRYRWSGREYDAETGSYYLRARYYSPDLRRFTQEDPAGLAGGNNLYAYAAGGPLEANDPSGLAPSGAGALVRDLAVQYGPNPAGNYATLGGWDGWFGISGSLLGRRITYVLGGANGPQVIDAPIEVVQRALDGYDDYAKAFEANQSQLKESTAPVKINGDSALSVGQLWSDMSALSRDQFTAALAFTLKDAAMYSHIEHRFQAGNIGVGDLAPDMYARKAGVSPNLVWGGTVGPWTELRPTLFTNGPLHNMVVHETYHEMHPDWNERRVCWAANNALVGRAQCF
jgi:RHS repeat-associated protein